MWDVEKDFFRFYLDKILLFIICLIAAFVVLWHGDEGNISHMLDIFKKTNVDTIMVTDNGKPIGMLDIQDLESN